MKSLSSLLDRYPASFLRSSAHVFLNPVQTVLLSQLLPLATNVEAVANSIRLVVIKMSPSFALLVVSFFLAFKCNIKRINRRGAFIRLTVLVCFYLLVKFFFIFIWKKIVLSGTGTSFRNFMKYRTFVSISTR